MSNQVIIEYSFDSVYSQSSLDNEQRSLFEGGNVRLLVHNELLLAHRHEGLSAPNTIKRTWYVEGNIIRQNMLANMI